MTVREKMSLPKMVSIRSAGVGAPSRVRAGVVTCACASGVKGGRERRQDNRAGAKTVTSGATAPPRRWLARIAAELDADASLQAIGRHATPAGAASASSMSEKSGSGSSV